MMGLSQNDVAQALGLSQQSYSEKELGNVKFNQREMIAFKILVSRIKPDITIDELFFSD